MDTMQMERSKNEIVRISEKRYRDKIYFDIRIWFRNGSSSEEFLPTRKGIFLTEEKFEEFKNLISKS